MVALVAVADGISIGGLEAVAIGEINAFDRLTTR